MRNSSKNVNRPELFNPETRRSQPMAIVCERHWRELNIRLQYLNMNKDFITLNSILAYCKLLFGFFLYEQFTKRIPDTFPSNLHPLKIICNFVPTRTQVDSPAYFFFMVAVYLLFASATFFLQFSLSFYITKVFFQLHPHCISYLVTLHSS